MAPTDLLNITTRCTGLGRGRHGRLRRRLTLVKTAPPTLLDIVTRSAFR